MSMAWTAGKLRETGNPADLNYADQLEAMLAARGRDVRLPGGHRPLIGQEDVRGGATAWVVGSIAILPGQKKFTRPIIAERSGISKSTVSHVTADLALDGLIDETGRLGKGRGARFIVYQPSSTFEQAVRTNPEWLRATRIQELMIAMRLEKELVFDGALELLTRMSVHATMDN